MTFPCFLHHVFASDWQAGTFETRIPATQPPRLCFCMRNLGGFSFSGVA
jgi:hypothetical protein